MIRLWQRFVTRHPVLGAMWEAVGIGLSAIRAYKMRAGLTILGVVMGIMTVTGMSSIVAGLNASMARQIETLGPSLIFIRPFGAAENVSRAEARRRRGLTQAEIEALAELPAIEAVSPLELTQAELIKYGNQRVETAQVIGGTPEYEPVHELYVERGRFVSQADVDRSAKVVVLGADIIDALFPWTEALGKELNIDGRRFTVIGTIERRGKFLGRSMDNVVFVPLGTLQRSTFFDFLVADVKPVSAAQIETAVDQMRELLRRKKKLRYDEKDNFAIFTQDTLTNLYRQITGGIYIVMIAISSIGLVVGGVGVMNIMLVSVTERTREIGVRKALGAKRRDVLWQFLTEAMTLTGVGGLLGILVGAAIASLVNAFSPFPAVIQPTWVLVALVTSMGVGLVFGLWPAAKAARLDPIEALRYE
jgi:putative ABC transport system permease protein